MHERHNRVQLLLEGHESLKKVPCVVPNERYENLTLTKQLKCQRKLVLTGRGHLFDASVTTKSYNEKTKRRVEYFPGIANNDQFLFNQIKKRDKKSPVAELRDFLDTQAYVILCPKLG